MVRQGVRNLRPFASRLISGSDALLLFGSTPDGRANKTRSCVLFATPRSSAESLGSRCSAQDKKQWAFSGATLCPFSLHSEDVLLSRWEKSLFACFASTNFVITAVVDGTWCAVVSLVLLSGSLKLTANSHRAQN